MTRLEAEQCIGRAKEALHVSYFIFKFTPDYIIAGSEYTRAAEIYEQLNDKEKAMETYLLVANVRRKDQDYYSSGKAVEKAAFLYISS